MHEELGHLLFDRELASGCRSASAERVRPAEEARLAGDLKHSEVPVARANPDRVVEGQDGGDPLRVEVDVFIPLYPHIAVLFDIVEQLAGECAFVPQLDDRRAFHSHPHAMHAFSEAEDVVQGIVRNDKALLVVQRAGVQDLHRVAAGAPQLLADEQERGDRGEADEDVKDVPHRLVIAHVLLKERTRVEWA